MNTVQQDSEQSSRRSSTAVRHQDLQEQLVAAAEAEIVTAGVAELRARTVARTAGCSVGAIYNVFPDLDGLVLGVNGRTLDAIGAEMSAVGIPTAGGVNGSVSHLVCLASAYLDYAAANRLRWSALFQHRMPPGRTIPEAYAERQMGLFALVETPLAVLLPNLPLDERALLARSLFAAVHGMVELGLDEKVAVIPLAVLHAQVRLLVEAIARGLAPGDDRH